MAAIAAVVVLGAAIGWLLAPPVPTVEQASAQEVAGFLADPRGAVRLSESKRRAFVYSLVDRYTSDQDRQALADALDGLQPSERAAVRELLFGVMKDEVLADAAQWRRLADAQAQWEFLDQHAGHYDRLRLWMIGSRRGIDLTKHLFDGLDGHQEMIQFVLSHTTPEEQELARAYLEALAERQARLQMERAVEALRKEAAGSAPATQP